MIYAAPNTPNPALAQQTQQTQILQTDLNALADRSVGDYFRGLKLRQYIQQVIATNESRQVTTDVSIIDLQTQRSIVGHNIDQEQFAASINKIPIAQLVLNDLRSGRLQLNQQISWTSDEVREGSGVYDQPGAPMQASVQDLLFDMLNPSGNTAVRAFVNHALGGAATVNQRFTNELGLHHTALQILDATRFYVGNTNAKEALQSMQNLLSGNDAYQQFVKHALATNIYTNFGVRSQLSGDPNILLVNKVGILDDPDGNNRHDVGIVYNLKEGKAYGYAFLNTAPDLGGHPSEEVPTNQAGISLADMGQALLKFAGDKGTSPQTDHRALPAPQAERGRTAY